MPSLLLALALAAADPTASLRCDGRLVASGDFDFQLRETCGEPYYIEPWFELRSQGLGPDGALLRTIRYEDWYFDFGPNRFLQRVRLREGQIVQIETLTQRGRRQPASNCRAQLRAGLSSGELLKLCGAPQRRDDLEETLRLGREPAEEWIPTRHERWVYRLSDRRVMQIWLRAGRIERIQAD
jgi:hypothetical protein